MRQDCSSFIALSILSLLALFVLRKRLIKELFDLMLELYLEAKKVTQLQEWLQLRFGVQSISLI